MAAKAAYVIF